MLSSAVIQIIAMVTMAIDHVGLYLLGDNVLCRIIGRIAFPLFAFMLVEGFKHTRSRPKYYARIVVTAVISQIILFFLDTAAHLEYRYNVLFTLGFAFVALILAERGKFWLVGIPFLVLMAGSFECDYAIFGILMIVGFYYADKLFKNNRPVRLLADFAVLAAMMLSEANYDCWSIQNWAILAIIPIALYSGKKGHRLPKMLTYSFYPLHLLIILLILLIRY